MLRVTIELLPGGDQERARVLGVMQIAQKEIHEKPKKEIHEKPNGEHVYDYTIVADENPNSVTNQPYTTGKYTLKNIDRNQSVYSLVAKAATEVARGFRERVKRKAYATAKESKAKEPTGSK